MSPGEPGWAPFLFLTVNKLNVSKNLHDFDASAVNISRQHGWGEREGGDMCIAHYLCLTQQLRQSGKD